MSLLNTMARGLSSPYHMAEAAANYARHARPDTFEPVTELLTLDAAAAPNDAAVHDEKRGVKRAYFAAAAPLILKELLEQCKLPAGVRGAVEVSIGTDRFTIEENIDRLTLKHGATGEYREIHGKDFEQLLFDLANDIARDPQTYGTEAAEAASELRAPALDIPEEVFGQITKHLDVSDARSLIFVSRSFGESAHVRAAVMEARASALIGQKGLAGLEKALVLITDLPPSLRLRSLNILARKIGWLQPREDRPHAFDALATAAQGLAPDDKCALFGSLVRIIREVYRDASEAEFAAGWSTCCDAILSASKGAPVEDLNALVVALVTGDATGTCRQSDFDRLLAAVGQLDDSPSKTQTLYYLVHAVDQFSAEHRTSNLAAILPMVLELDGSHPEKASALHTIVNLLPHPLSQKDVPVAFQVAADAVAHMKADNPEWLRMLSVPIVDRLLSAFDHLAEADIPTARAQVLPFFQDLINDGFIHAGQLRQYPGYVRMMNTNSD